MPPDEQDLRSPRHPLVKRARALLRHEGRVASDVIAVEGLRAIVAAAEAGLTFEAALVAPDRLRGPTALAALERVRASGATVATVAAATLDDLSTRDASQGMVALVQRPTATLARLRSTGPTLVVALHRPQDPANVGAIARTADGAGAAALVILGGGVDPFHPRAVRASMGSLFTLPVVALADPAAGLRALRARGCAIVGAAGQGAVDLWDAPLRGRVVIALGTERTGLPPDALAECDTVARIPLLGQADSLNVAAAAAIFLFEAVRQRRE